jgi:hypothetical protein
VGQISGRRTDVLQPDAEQRVAAVQRRWRARGVSNDLV